MSERVVTPPPFKTNQIVINDLSEQSKDICIWFFSGGIAKVLDKYASEAVQPGHSFEALQFLQSLEDKTMQANVDGLAVRLVYMHAPEVIVTPRGMVPTPLASHRLYKQ